MVEWRETEGEAGKYINRARRVTVMKMTLTRTKWLLALLALNGAVMAQGPAQLRRVEMKKLDFLVGQWTGEGWIEFVPGQRRTFRQTESVQPKVDGEILLIDGLGKGKVPGKDEEVTVHSAFAVVSCDEKAKMFRWRAYTAGGNWIDTEAKVGDNSLEWGFHDERVGDIRFTIRLDKKAQWVESGAISGDGKTWRQFFLMTLDRMK
jgi:hypothetical protein